MKTEASLKYRQGGAVAVMVGISMVMLIGFLAIVIDLGHLYVAKTGLQNAADAAALSGAKQLDGSADGICCGDGKSGTKLSAVYMAIEVAQRNKFFGNSGQQTVSIGSANESNSYISLSNTPNGPWVDIATAKTSPGDKSFIKVNTASDNLTTWFAPLLNIFTTSTFGMAVAGRYSIQVTPLGVCAVDKTRPELGFIRGVAYDVPRLNPLTISADKLWINPIDAPPGPCNDPQFDARAKMAPFVCTGKSMVVRTVPGQVYVNTGKIGALGKELDSRFNDYQGSLCTPSTALPDTNIMQYVNHTDFPNNPADPTPKVDVDWMSSLPSQQSITIIDDYATTGVQKGKPIAKTQSSVRTSPSVFTYTDKKGDPANYTVTFKDYGVLWSYAWEYNFGAGQNHALSDWTSLYLDPDAASTASKYPSSPAAPHPSPDQSGLSKYTSSISTGEANRRFLNLVIIDCDAGASQLGSGNKCLALDTLAVGEFFMTVKAGNLANLYLEFSKIVAPPMPPAEIRLYR